MSGSWLCSSCQTLLSQLTGCFAQTLTLVCISVGNGNGSSTSLMKNVSFASTLAQRHAFSPRPVHAQWQQECLLLTQVLLSSSSSIQQNRDYVQERQNTHTNISCGFTVSRQTLGTKQALLCWLTKAVLQTPLVQLNWNFHSQALSQIHNAREDSEIKHFCQANPC